MIRIGKQKRQNQKPIDKDSKKHIFIDEVSKRSSTMPGPWTYSTRPKWIKDHKVIEITETAQQQQKRQIWQGISKDKIEIVKQEKAKVEKPNKDAKKLSFIDQIYRDNQKESFPKPAPNQYFMDEKAVKKFYKENNKDFPYENKATIKKSIIPK